MTNVNKTITSVTYKLPLSSPTLQPLPPPRTLLRSKTTSLEREKRREESEKQIERYVRTGTDGPEDRISPVGVETNGS